MATGDYIALATLKSGMGLTSTTYDTALQQAISSASRAVDNLCNRRFYADSIDQTYYYTPVLSNKLNLDIEFDAITTVSVDFNADGVFEQTWVVNTEYIAYPLNRTTPYRPIQWIETHPLTARFFPIGYPRTVQIVGKAGWGTIPDPIISCTSLLAEQVFKRIGEAPFGVLGFADTAAYIARVDPQYSALVAPYRRLS